MESSPSVSEPPAQLPSAFIPQILVTPFFGSRSYDCCFTGRAKISAQRLRSPQSAVSPEAAARPRRTLFMPLSMHGDVNENAAHHLGNLRDENFDTHCEIDSIEETYSGRTESSVDYAEKEYIVDLDDSEDYPDFEELGEDTDQCVDIEQAEPAKLPVVAVIGRPNVGKSMLVNRIAEQFNSGSIVENVVGITRDRTYRSAWWGKHHFQIVDTGGLVFDDNSMYVSEIRSQAIIALNESSAAILVVDGQEGLNPLDTDLAKFLRKDFAHMPVYIAVNKCESDSTRSTAAEFWALGLGDPYPVSAIHGSGTGDLMDQVVSHLPIVTESALDHVCNVAIVGRPNVGKSSLLNGIVGSERAIVSNVPGTTRDAIDELVTVNGKSYRLIDTAGIRRKSSINYGTEFFMINRAFKAIRRADVAVLVVDVSSGAFDQDRKIAERIASEGKACVIVGNKWDLVEEKNNSSYKKSVELIREKLSCIPWAEVELVSALTKQRTSKILQYVDSARAENCRRVSTAVLNDVLKEAIDWHKPPSTRLAKQGRIYYCTQVASSPPTVVMFVNDPRLFNDNYKRYMERQFRQALSFRGTPLRILWRGKSSASALK